MGGGVLSYHRFLRLAEVSFVKDPKCIFVEPKCLFFKRGPKYPKGIEWVGLKLKYMGSNIFRYMCFCLEGGWGGACSINSDSCHHKF